MQKIYTLETTEYQRNKEIKEIQHDERTSHIRGSAEKTLFKWPHN
jgi:hypothetical protein